MLLISNKTAFCPVACSMTLGRGKVWANQPWRSTANCSSDCLRHLASAWIVMNSAPRPLYKQANGRRSKEGFRVVRPDVPSQHDEQVVGDLLTRQHISIGDTMTSTVPVSQLWKSLAFDRSLFAVAGDNPQKIRDVGARRHATHNAASIHGHPRPTECSVGVSGINAPGHSGDPWPHLFAYFLGGHLITSSSARHHRALRPGPSPCALSEDARVLG